MKHSPRIIGALQAFGLAAYIIFVASVIQTIGSIAPDSEVNPLFGASLFLLLFSTSALICGTITLGYPIMLFFMKDKKREAMEAVGWTIVWLIVFALLFVLYFLTYGPLLR